MATIPKQGSMTWVIFLGLLIDLLAFTLILPLFPALLDFYRQHDDNLYPLIENKIQVFNEQVLKAPQQFNNVLFGGVLGSLFSFLQFVASPIIGGMSDYWGRRPMLLLSTLGICGSYLIWTTANTFGLFVLARVVGGLAKGNVSLATAIVTDDSTSSTRGRGMALIGIAFSIGFIAGPMIGASFSIWARNREQSDDLWFVYPALCALALSVIDFVYLFVYFKETLPKQKRLKNLNEAIMQALSYINPLSLFTFASLSNLGWKEHRSLCTLGQVNFLYLFFYSGLEFTLTFLTHIRFNFTAMQQGKMFLFVGITMALVQGGYVRRVGVGRELSHVIVGLLMIIPSFLMVGFSHSLVTLYSGLFLYSVSTALVVPCLSTMVSTFGDDSQKGIVMGVYRSLGALGRALGPVVASIIYWMLGPEVAYTIGGSALIVPCLMLCRLRNKDKAA